jgi:hypothetical protein
MSKKIEGIGAYVAVAIGTIAIAGAFFRGITYVATHEKTVIMHSDTGDYACTVWPLSNGPTSCKPIEGTK